MVITGMSEGKRALQADKIGEGPSLGGRDAEPSEGICFSSIFSTINSMEFFFL